MCNHLLWNTMICVCLQKDRELRVQFSFFILFQFFKVLVICRKF